MKYLTFLFFLLLLLAPLKTLKAQNDTANTETNNGKVRVFIDCRQCDDSYIRTEITFVNFVRDKEDAQVHLLITRQRAGSGSEFTLQFLGRKNFSGQDNVQKFNSPSSDTEDDERRGLLESVKQGLLPYVSQTDIVNDLEITYNPSAEETASQEDDPWNSWIFELEGNMFFNGEESSNNIFLNGGVEAERITQKWKIRTNYNYDYNRREETFTETNSLGNESNITEVFITRGQRFDGSSIGSHWAGGLFGEAATSTRNNFDLVVGGGPGIEYNLFPYNEYTEREFTFAYLITPSYRNYADTTIFNKTEEFLVKHQLASRAEFTQPWGEIEWRANFSAFTQDLSKNRLDINLEVDFRIFRGLSINFSGRYSLINDQLSVPKGDITDAEQLLDLRQRLTGFSYRGSVGIEYTFGSIYNSVVNPRF